MGFGFKIEPGEHLILAEVYSPSRTVESFAVGVSDRAVFVSAPKRFSLGGRWWVDRVPLDEVLCVSISTARPYIWWLSSGILIVVSLLGILDLIAAPWLDVAASPSYLLGLLVVGAVIPFVVRSRRKLTVSTQRHTYKWRPSATINRRQRDLAHRIQSAFAEACRQVRLSVELA